MAVETRINIPFLPQESLTNSILTAIQLANVHQRQQQETGIQQQQTNIAAQKAPAEIEEAKARTGLYGSQAQKNQIEIDNMRKAQQMFGAPSQQPQGSNATWLPQNTPQQLAPFVSAMIPQDLNDQEKNIIEGGAQTGRMKAVQTGDLSQFLNDIRSGVDSVVANRNKIQNQPENQPVSADDRKNFLENVLPSMENLSAAQKVLARGALNSTKSQKELQGLQARLMQQDNQALERKIQQENLVANRKMMLENEEGKTGLSDILKVWTDPQHGFGQTLAQANLGKATIKAGADGNGLLTSLEPTMAVLGMNSFAGVHRISPAEATAAGAPGGWAERFGAWADKASQGKLSAQLAREGNQLFDQLIQAKHQQALQATQLIVANTPGMDEKNIRVSDQDGKMVKFTDAVKGQPKTAQPATTSAISPEASNYLKSIGVPPPQ